jgi:membrane associated rhomboid family serine protease
MDRVSPLQLAAVVLGGALALMWATELADAIVFDGDLDANGILPRRASGIDGILWAPLLHRGFGHLVSNSFPFLVLGALVMTEGLRRWAWVTAIVVLGGGGLTWLLARSRVHIGASGLIFGYVGYLLASAYFTRSLRAIAVALVVGVVYGGGLIIGLLPRPGISWEGHLFGVLAGIAAAFLLHREPPPPPRPA